MIDVLQVVLLCILIVLASLWLRETIATHGRTEERDVRNEDRDARQEARDIKDKETHAD